jgi:hypothetical protein
MNDKLQQLAQGRRGKAIIEALQEVQKQVADIRTPLKIRPEIANEVRLGIIEALDTFLIEKLRVYSGEIDPPNPNEHI